MRLRTLSLLLPLAALACSSTTNTTTTGDCDASVAASDAGTDSSTGPSVLSFKPSNVTLDGLDLSKAGDVIITGANCGIADTEGLSWSCVDKFAAKQITLPDQSKLTVFVVKSLRIEPDALVTIGTGAHPLAIVALDTILIAGKVRLTPGKGGGAYNSTSETKGAGPGGGGGGTAAQKGAGAGGSFCGIGGSGNAEPGGTVHPKGVAYGTPELVPLLGGSAGGAGAIGVGSGSGGGAIQFTAGKSIEIKAGAFISVPGGGGNQGGLAGSQEATGGGSGGAILLEAEEVKIAGALAANGGGGGQGAGGDASGGASGENGRDDDQPGLGGVKGTNNHGGDGSAASSLDGKDGLTSAGSSASAGGGGAGRIRINTRSGSADITSTVVSPSKTSSCFSQGTLKN